MSERKQRSVHASRDSGRTPQYNPINVVEGFICVGPPGRVRTTFISPQRRRIRTSKRSTREEPTRSSLLSQLSAIVEITQPKTKPCPNPNDTSCSTPGLPHRKSAERGQL